MNQNPCAIKRRKLIGMYFKECAKRRCPRCGNKVTVAPCFICAIRSHIAIKKELDYGWSA